MFQTLCSHLKNSHSILNNNASRGGTIIIAFFVDGESFIKCYRSFRRENKDLQKSMNFQGQETKVTWLVS